MSKALADKINKAFPGIDFQDDSEEDTVRVSLSYPYDKWREEGRQEYVFIDLPLSTLVEIATKFFRVDVGDLVVSYREPRDYDVSPILCLECDKSRRRPPSLHSKEEG